MISACALDLLGSFALPAGYTNDQSYYTTLRTSESNPVDEITTDVLNDVFVYDGTGMHIYRDDSSRAAKSPEFIPSLSLLSFGRDGEIRNHGHKPPMWRDMLPGDH